MKLLSLSSGRLFVSVLLFTHAASSFALDFEACKIQHRAVKLDAECATLVRPENPNLAGGRQIELFVARLPATTPNPKADAFTVIQGGPGGSSVNLAIGLRNVIDLVRRKRDVLLIDQRGTGRSHTLRCAEGDPNSEFDVDLVTELTRSCLAELSKTSDLSHYTTSVATQDLEAVRAAAGYPQLSIYGVSYGTRVAQHYLRRFPEQTRLLVIDGVVDLDVNLAGSEIALRSQTAFDNMAARCSINKTCKAQFGDIKDKFNRLQQRLKESPVTINTRHPRTGELLETQLGEQDLLISARLMPYATETLSLLPLLIAQAYEGDYQLLAAQSLLNGEGVQELIALGMHNSVFCTEDEPYIDYETQASAANTYFGTNMQDAMKATCAEWPRGAIDEDFRETFDSDKPVLILSGETDPITPPDNGERAANMFSNSLHLIMPAHGHGVLQRGCMPFLVNEFLESSDLTALNTQCIERERAAPFFLNASGGHP